MFDKEDIHFFVTSVATIATSYSLYKVMNAQAFISEKRKMIKQVNRSTIKSP